MSGGMGFFFMKKEYGSSFVNSRVPAHEGIECQN